MRWILLIVLALQTAMCGQKGPLYLPEKTTVHTRAPTTTEQHRPPAELRAPGNRS